MSSVRSSRLFPLRVTRVASRVFAAAALASVLGACDSPTAPQASVEEPAARQTTVCVGTTADGQMVLVQPVSGRCPSGFDLQPWW